MSRMPSPVATRVKYGTIAVNGLNIAYREAGDPESPKLVLLHGWPSSSHQFRDLIVALAPRFHVIAPDYQGLATATVRTRPRITTRLTRSQ